MKKIVILGIVAIVILSAYAVHAKRGTSDDKPLLEENIDVFSSVPERLTNYSLPQSLS